MNNSKLFLGLLLGLVIGALGAYIIWSPAQQTATDAASGADTTIQQMEAKRLEALIMESTQIVFDIPDSRDIPASDPLATEDAARLLAKYKSAGPHFKNTNNEILLGWFLEKDMIDSLFDTHTNANGIRIYLGKHDTQTNKSHCLIWMASKLNDGENPVDTTGSQNYFTTNVLQYVRPCPPYCKKSQHKLD